MTLLIFVTWIDMATDKTLSDEWKEGKSRRKDGATSKSKRKRRAVEVKV